MPQTQVEVERILEIRRLRHEATELRQTLIDIYQTHRMSYPITEDVLTQYPEIIALHRELEAVYVKVEELRNLGELNVNGQIKFTRKCPIEECKGFLNEEYFCGLCRNNFCKDCLEPIGDDHACDPRVVKTMKLLNRDSKSCPKCGTVIYKSSGCSQMWCINCHTAFDWRSGEIATGRIHNPHFIEFKRKGGASREHGDIPCGGIPTYRELRQAEASDELLNLSTYIFYADRENAYIDLEPVHNLHTRVAYMLNQLDEKTFKTFLQRQEKFKDKMRDISHIFEMLTHTGGDLLRQFILEPSRQLEIVDLLSKLLTYGNEIFETIRKRYNCVLPKNLYF